MEPLNIARINITSPYKVWNEDATYRFETDYGSAGILEQENPGGDIIICVNYLRLSFVDSGK